MIVFSRNFSNSRMLLATLLAASPATEVIRFVEMLE